MTATVCYSLMADVRRLDGVARVLGQLNRTCEVVVDHEARGPWLGSGKAAWEKMSRSDAEWCCLLQDDIDLAEGFAEQLELLCSSPLLSSRPLALYNGLKDLPYPGTYWIERRDGVQGPVIAMAKDDVKAMLAWVERNVRETLLSADIRPSLWLESQSRTSLCPWPSWVEHRGWEPSLLGTQSGVRTPRTSPSFTGDPLSVYDWTKGLAPNAAFKAGLPFGASGRVRTKLWRVGVVEPDRKATARATR